MRSPSYQKIASTPAPCLMCLRGYSAFTCLSLCTCAFDRLRLSRDFPFSPSISHLYEGFFLSLFFHRALRSALAHLFPPPNLRRPTTTDLSPAHLFGDLPLSSLPAFFSTSLATVYFNSTTPKIKVLQCVRSSTLLSPRPLSAISTQAEGLLERVWDSPQDYPPLDPCTNFPLCVFFLRNCFPLSLTSDRSMVSDCLSDPDFSPPWDHLGDFFNISQIWCFLIMDYLSVPPHFFFPWRHKC